MFINIVFYAYRSIWLRWLNDTPSMNLTLFNMQNSYVDSFQNHLVYLRFYASDDHDSSEGDDEEGNFEDNYIPAGKLFHQLQQ